MRDESGDNDEIACPECGADTSEDCPHILAVIDVTFGQCEGGAAYELWDKYTSRVTEVFQKHLADGVKPDWKHFEVQEVWDALELPEDPEDFCLPFEAFADLMVAVFEEAGGVDHPGDLTEESGGRCESEVRILYAKKPKKVCEKAVAVLEQWLTEMKPSDAGE